jgi:hypothetical protein
MNSIARRVMYGVSESSSLTRAGFRAWRMAQPEAMPPPSPSAELAQSCHGFSPA